MHRHHPWLILAALLSSISGFVAWDLHGEYERVQAEARRHLGEFAEIAANNVAHELEGVNRALGTLRADPALERPVILASIVASIDGLQGLAIANREGVVTASTDRSLVGRDVRSVLADPPADDDAGLDRLQVIPGRLGDSGQLPLHLARTRVDAEGRAAGLVIATIDTAHLTVALKSVTPWPDMRAGFATPGGMVIARHPDPEGAAGRQWSPAFRDAAREATVRSPGRGHVEIAHTGFMPNRLVAYRAIEIAGLEAARPHYAFASRDRDAILAPWWRDFARRVIRLAVFAAFAITGVWLLQRRQRAIRKLEEALAVEREAAERQYHAAAERIRLAHECAHLGHWHWDLAKGRIEADATMRQHFGLPADPPDFDYGQLLLAIHPDDRDRTAAAVARSAEDGTRLRCDFRIVTDAGEARWLNALGQAFPGADGRPARFEAITQDITKRKVAEGELIASREALAHRSRQVEQLNVELEGRAIEAEASARAKDAFLRNMSHELRTPLNHISGGTEILLMSDPTPEQHGWIRTIQAASRDLLEMLNAILDVARGQTGQLPLNPVVFSPHSVIDEVRAMMDTRARTKGLALASRIDPTVPARLVGDATRMAQALLAYLDNAIKFTEQGEVEIAVRPLPSPGEAVHLRFEVRDTGIGIARDQHARLFTPFSQVDDTITRAYGGAGIGLSKVKMIARQMGGEVGFASEPGKGSTFWFTVRLAIPAPAPGEAEAAAA